MDVAVLLIVPVPLVVAVGLLDSDIDLDAVVLDEAERDCLGDVDEVAEDDIDLVCRAERLYVLDEEIVVDCDGETVTERDCRLVPLPDSELDCLGVVEGDFDEIVVNDPEALVVDDLEALEVPVPVTVPFTLPVDVEETVFVLEEDLDPLCVAEVVLVREEDDDTVPANEGLGVKLAAEVRVPVIVVDRLLREVAEAEDVRVEVELLVPEGVPDEVFVITGARDRVELADPDFVTIGLRLPTGDALAVRVATVLLDAELVAEEDLVKALDLVALAVAELDRLCLVEAV